MDLKQSEKGIMELSYFQHKFFAMFPVNDKIGSKHHKYKTNY